MISLSHNKLIYSDEEHVNKPSSDKLFKTINLLYFLGSDSIQNFGVELFY